MAATMDNQQKLQAFRERLQRLASLAPNKLCAECPEPQPTWASILEPPLPGGQRLGVLCCYNCSTFHHQLGKRIGTVKSINMVEEWTEEEIETLERGGGNQIINALYESGLSKATYNKWMVLPNKLEEETTRKEFIQNKYQQLEYFDPVLYQAHLHRMKSQKSSSSGAQRPRRARRCRSFEDPNSTIVQEKGRRDFVRKPLRRRSQSFQEDRFTTDDESTDDEQRLSYNLPGHLKSMSTSNPEASGRRRARRSSMPGLGGFATSHKLAPKSSTPRKQRRASMKPSSRRDEEDTPSDAELGYGREDDGDMDSTLRWSNRRRNSRDGKDTAPTPMANNSSSRWKSGRRNSLPSAGLGAPRPSPSSDADNTDTSDCESMAPKMPTRCISDDSGDDFDLGNETDDTGFMSPPPSRPALDRIPRRLRRSSMPTASSDEDDLSKHTYRPSLPRLTRFDKASQASKLYGMDLGYGFAKGSRNGDQLKKANNNSQHLLRPVRMPRVGGNGGPAFTRSSTNPCRPPPKMLPNDSDSAMSSDEVNYGLPSPTARKTNHHANHHHHHRRKRASRSNRRTMRRCSTGGALDKTLCGRKAPSPESSFEAIPRPNESTTPGGLPTLKVQNPSASHAHSTLTNLMDIAVAPPCYADLVRSPLHDEFPSMEDLGYGDYGGHESLGTIMSIDTTEDPRYKVDLGYGRFEDRREDEEESNAISAALSRMPRRSSAGAHHRRASNGTPRRGSNTGAFGPPLARRRCSQKAQDEGLPNLAVCFQQQQQEPHRHRSSAQEPATRNSMLGGGAGSLLRADSLSSICSELSVNAPLLCSGETKYSSRGDSLGTASVAQGMKDDSALSSASPVSVSVFSALGYRSVFGEEVDPPACSDKNPADSASESAEQEPMEATEGVTTSAKDFWKSKIRESSPPVPATQDDGAPPYTQRRARKKSMTTACA